MDSRSYAALAADAYNTYPPGRRPVGREEKVSLDGVTYRLLEHVDRPSGYQGTVYQRVDTGEIVVAHRGTEFDTGKPMAMAKDLVVADGGMALLRQNTQVRDAIELTRHALDHAKSEGMRNGSQAPTVTVTGHSLGGTLAQATAHHFDLRGETFNPYGANSLGLRIPEGGSSVTNHVMAADLVSAAAGHYGQVRIYATPGEIRLLGRGGYDNTRSQADLREPLATAFSAIDSHSMHNFLDVDAQGRRDRSVLSDPRARALAVEYAPMIDKYRGDIHALRAGVTLAAGRQPGLVRDALDAWHGPRTPGAPMREEQERPPARPFRRPEIRAEQRCDPAPEFRAYGPHSGYLDLPSGAAGVRIPCAPPPPAPPLAGSGYHRLPRPHAGGGEGQRSRRVPCHDAGGGRRRSRPRAARAGDRDGRSAGAFGATGRPPARRYAACIAGAGRASTFPETGLTVSPRWMEPCRWNDRWTTQWKARSGTRNSSP